ncbi:hypothetical protein TGGT1_284780 [Toxoplasma gondii GT1]|uniref:Integral membrane bound transporter domain-containing protein n=5 Tax=Toxoplasma gondii TaxID=5811 RepID=S7W2W0_TOXGG|nr:hypothetical protein TGGT1_284780 [Toxoplasma gondii GT1]KAF4643915.1 hypothetical protein TGRH88_026710 [Toxoplasma gondii]KFG54672.1 fusaric acid resistance-like protein [Toxoplasma gondii FOU]PUA87941.1 fusaric acid resistance-like protein [Toxoplasma gondii TgCATBr9]RQX67118.1 fusaric acid resistance-like protein [Toxoplasma gondii CAST]
MKLLRFLWPYGVSYRRPEGQEAEWTTATIFPAQSSVAANVARRFEKGIRLALGGALVYVLSMIDIPSLDYSFRYVAPFVYWVVASLTPPFWSTVPLLLFAGLFCIVCVCGCVSALVALMTLGDPHGKIATVLIFALFVLWALGLNVGKYKEMTVIGSYIFMYVMPLATLIALPYGVGGVTIPISAEIIAKMKALLEQAAGTPEALEAIIKVLAGYLGEDPASVQSFIDKFFSDPRFVNLIILKINAQTHANVPLFPFNGKIDPVVVLQKLVKLFFSLFSGDELIDLHFPLKDVNELDPAYNWLNGAPCSVYGTLNSGIYVTVETGLWLINVLWTADGRVGFLRNLIAFAALGYAIWILVMLIPPIHRQRDVVRRDMANCTININRCLRATREVLHCLEGPRGPVRQDGGRNDSRCALSPSGRSNDPTRHRPACPPAGSPTGAGGASSNSHTVNTPYRGSSHQEDNSRGGCKSLGVSHGTGLGSSPSYIKAISFSSAKFVEAVVPLKQSIIKLTEDQKRVFMSAMEPYMLSVGPRVFVMKEVNEVRERLLQCATYVQQLCKVLFDVVRTSVVSSEFSIWTPTVYKIEAIIAKAEELYQTCGELIMMQPATINREGQREIVDEKLAHLKELEAQLASLHQEISTLANEATDKVFYEFGGPPRSTEDDQLSSRRRSPSASPASNVDTPSPTSPVGPKKIQDMEAARPAQPTTQSEGEFGSSPPSLLEAGIPAPQESPEVVGHLESFGSPSRQHDPTEGVAGAVGTVDGAPPKRGNSERFEGRQGTDGVADARTRRFHTHVGHKCVSKHSTSFASLDQKEARNVSRTMDHMPLSMALIAKYHAAYKEPVALARAVQALHEAQRRKSWKNVLLNIAFPLLPMVVHAARLTITPLQQFMFWRKTWRGRDAWWRDPEFWHLVKFFIPMITLFSLAVFNKDVLQYTWGQQLTDDPMILDYCLQGITTRTVPWIMLGFLTCLQTTYNGTVFRGMNRSVGIIAGSGAAWVVMYVCGDSVAKIVCFSVAMLFVVVFTTTDTQNPNYGFHSVWGYAGMVFTYTHALIVGLSFESLGGLTGSRDYLVVTRIFSNLIGILLAIVVAHLPPVCSGNNSAAERYGDSLKCCAKAIEKTVQYFLEASEPVNDPVLQKVSNFQFNTQVPRPATNSPESFATTDTLHQASRLDAFSPAVAHADAAGAVTVAAAAQNAVHGTVPVEINESSALTSAAADKAGSQAKAASPCGNSKGTDGVPLCGGFEGGANGATMPNVRDVAEDSLQEALRLVRGPAADYLEAGQRFYKEGCSKLVYFPWHTNPVLEEVYLAVGSMRNRVEDMCELLKDFMTEGYGLDDRMFAFSEPAVIDKEEENLSGKQARPGSSLGDVAEAPTQQCKESPQAGGERASGAEAGERAADGTASPPEIVVHAAASSKIERGFGDKRKGSLYVLKEGNATAITELFKTHSGAQLRREMAVAVRALTELTDAVTMELRLLVPTTVDRFMTGISFSRKKTQVEPELPDAVHERCRDHAETAFSHLLLTLSSCLVEHRLLFEDSIARRRAAAFTVMAIIYYLDMQKRSLDIIRESLVARRGNNPQDSWCPWCCRPGVETLGID